MGWKEIVGQHRIVSFLDGAIHRGKIAHAYVFDGPKGIGKMNTALAFAKAIECKNYQGEACNVCSSCIKFHGNNHPDITIIEPDGQSIKNKQIEEFQQDLLLKPYESQKKIYIVNQADEMTVSAQNRLLKTLEEPPEYAVIILISTNFNRFLPTIRSRCQILKFHRVGEKEIITYLRDKHHITGEEAKLLAAFSDGIPQKALDLKNAEDFIKRREVTIEVIDQLLKKDSFQIFSMFDFFQQYKDDITEILDFMIAWFRDILFLSGLQAEDYLINLDRKSQLERHSRTISYDKISNVIEIIEKTKKDIRSNVNFQLAIEIMLLSIQEV
ncbi:MAG: DNA polymerase III subunit delta' [Bacillota bacterium]